MDSAEASGKTVEDALNRALAQIGATRDDVNNERVSFEVLDEGRKGGLFGRGGKDATVRATRVAGSASSPAARPREDRGPRPEGQGQRDRGGRGRGGDNARPESAQRGGGRSDGGQRDGGGSDAPRSGGARGTRGGGSGGGSRVSQTRTGFEQPVPKLTDADFTRPKDGGGTEAPATAPDTATGRGAPRGARGPRDGQGAPDAPRAERPPRADRPEREDRPD